MGSECSESGSLKCRIATTRYRKLEDLGRLMERYELEGDRRFSNDVFEAGLDFESSVLFYWVWMPVAVLRERVRYRGQPDRGTTG